MSLERKELMRRACAFLAKREHSRKELAGKLKRCCNDEVLLETVLEELTQDNLQCDQRFTESFIYHCINKGQGPNKIQHDLNQRGIDSLLIEQHFDCLEIDWLAMAVEVRNKKYGASFPSDYQNKAKQARFLYSRGFTGEQINQVLNLA